MLRVFTQDEEKAIWDDIESIEQMKEDNQASGDHLKRLEELKRLIDRNERIRTFINRGFTVVIGGKLNAEVA